MPQWRLKRLAVSLLLTITKQYLQKKKKKNLAGRGGNLMTGNFDDIMNIV